MVAAFHYREAILHSRHRPVHGWARIMKFGTAILVVISDLFEKKGRHSWGKKSAVAQSSNALTGYISIHSNVRNLSVPGRAKPISLVMRDYTTIRSIK